MCLLRVVLTAGADGVDVDVVVAELVGDVLGQICDQGVLRWGLARYSK